MTRTTTHRLRIPLLLAPLLITPFTIGAQQPPQSTQPSDNPSSASYSIKTSVRRVVVDVVVTDAQGKSKRGLTEKDFSVEEDNKPQHILSFDPHAGDVWTNLLPANMPPNTFVNLPRQPEQGPLYVLLYDMANLGDHRLVDSDTGNQINARQQLVKFIQNPPPGARIAIMAISDGLHLIQGFTTDKQLLLAAVDPNGGTPHMPKVFLNGVNSRDDDPWYYLAVMKDIAQSIGGLPGRKNLIWISRKWPFAVLTDENPPELTEQVRKELSDLAEMQIAIYPVDVSTVHSVNMSNMVLDDVAERTAADAPFRAATIWPARSTRPSPRAISTTHPHLLFHE